MSKKILFLYSELAGYTVSCLNELASKGVMVYVVRWEVNKEAPFTFEFHENIQVKTKTEFDESSLLELINTWNPSLIFVSGWMDKMYTSVAKKFTHKIPVVTGIDNQWNGTLKQKVGSRLSSFLVQDKFTHAFVAGEPQKVFAKKMGFKDANIITGLYTADTELFENYFTQTFNQKESLLPKRFLYVGRYLEGKGIFEMWQACTELKSEENIDWEVWCVGSGELFDQRIESEGIRHFGFVQPEELTDIIKESFVFILPSKNEPWGVVTQEYAAAGFPILSNVTVGSTSAYLNDGSNGCLLKDTSKEELKRGMKEFVMKSDEELIEMGQASHELSKNNSPKIWVENLLSILND
jgi:glycosyltransferase involved in cell wall biosynthesis